jgi:hypothetical protein
MKQLSVLLVFLISFLFYPGICNAIQIISGRVVIKMFGGVPCFSYPSDEFTHNEGFSFSNLGISNRNRNNVLWEIQIKSADRENLVDPDSPQTCLKYGTLSPGMKEDTPAKTLDYNTVYDVRMRVSSHKGGMYSQRNYRAFFCLTTSDQGEPIVVRAAYDEKMLEFRCLKPGESPKRSFLDWLFNREQL